MDNLARKLEDWGPFQVDGTVLRTEDGTFTVRTERGDLTARRAVSCLIAPRDGDRVLLAGVRGGCYVLAVLEREEASTTTQLAVDGDLEIKLPKGKLVVATQEGVDVVSGKDVSFVSRGLSINAVDGNVVLQRLSFLGTFVRAEVERIKAFAGSLDWVLDRLMQKVKRSYRVVEELDQVRAEHVDYVARKNMSLRGRHTLMTAEELVKVDGEQIHLG